MFSLSISRLHIGTLNHMHLRHETVWEQRVLIKRGEKLRGEHIYGCICSVYNTLMYGNIFTQHSAMYNEHIQQKLQIYK